MILRQRRCCGQCLDHTIIDGVNHPTWTAIYPPLTIHLEMLITHIDSRVSAMNVAAMVAEMIAMLFILALLLIERRVAASWWLLAWWNPVAILWFAGEGHNDSFMAVFLAAGLWLANRAQQKRSLIALSLACLAKPFVGLILAGSIASHWLAADLVAGDDCHVGIFTVCRSWHRVIS